MLASLAKSLVNFRGGLLIALKELGHDVLACAPEHESTILPALEQLGVAYRRVPIDRTGLNPWRDLLSFVALLRLFREEAPDMLLSYTAKPVILGSLAAQRMGVPRICSIITGLGYGLKPTIGKGRQLRPMLHYLYRGALASNSMVFFQNREDATLFRQSNLLSDTARSVVVNGSGVDIYEFPYVAPASNPPIFLLIARLIREKGIKEFVEAAIAVKAHHPKVKFQLVGPFESHPRSLGKSEVAKWINSGVIEHLGNLSDVRPVLAASSVYVLPSYYGEGIPRSILEALATGRPIITTDTPGCRETVLVGVNGFLVPPREIEPLSKAMIRFINEPSLLLTMGKRSRELAETKYDVRLVNQQILEALGLTASHSAGMALGH